MGAGEDLTREHVFCQECGAVRVFTPSGMRCPSGHGKIWPKIPSDVLRRYLRNEAMRMHVSCLPKAARVPATWTAGGRFLAWIAWANYQQILDGPNPGYVFALIDDRVAVFEVIK
jgi:hypothetical protein